MTRVSVIKHEFVDSIPAELVEGTLYISIRYATAVHRCCCGCGEEVVTPLTPTDWSLTYDGDTVSLDPSIGNWSLACRSHYWIGRNQIRWAQPWSEARIAAGRDRDRRAKRQYYGEHRPASPLKGDAETQQQSHERAGIRSRLARAFRGS